MYFNYLPVIPEEPLYYVKADLDYPKTFCFIITDNNIVFIFVSLFLLFIYFFIFVVYLFFYYLFLYLSHCICVVLFYLLSNSKTTTKYNCCVTRYWWQQQSSTNENDEEIFPSFLFPTCCYRFSQDFLTSFFLFNISQH